MCLILLLLPNLDILLLQLLLPLLLTEMLLKVGLVHAILHPRLVLFPQSLLVVLVHAHLLVIIHQSLHLLSSTLSLQSRLLVLRDVQLDQGVDFFALLRVTLFFLLMFD
jgi:hypothetical protein